MSVQNPANEKLFRSSLNFSYRIMQKSSNEKNKQKDFNLLKAQHILKGELFSRLRSDGFFVEKTAFAGGMNLFVH